MLSVQYPCVDAAQKGIDYNSLIYQNLGSEESGFAIHVFADNQMRY